MKTEIPVEQLLRWRLSQAEADAPPAPRAARLLHLARPWWEATPERFQSLVLHLGRIQVAFGHAMADTRPASPGHPVPALVSSAEGELEATALVLYFNIRDNRLRLRFRLDPTPAEALKVLEVTFISDQAAQPLFTTLAELSVDSDYRVDAELSEEVARNWEQLKVTDRMPFRLILRTASNPS